MVHQPYRICPFHSLTRPFALPFVWAIRTTQPLKVKVVQLCLSLCDPMDYKAHGKAIRKALKYSRHIPGPGLQNILSAWDSLPQIPTCSVLPPSSLYLHLNFHHGLLSPLFPSAHLSTPGLRLSSSCSDATLGSQPPHYVWLTLHLYGLAFPLECSLSIPCTKPPSCTQEARHVQKERAIL